MRNKLLVPLFLFASISACSTTNKISIQDQYETLSANCTVQFGSNISIERTNCLNTIDEQLAKQHNYPYMDLIHSLGKQRMVYTKKVLQGEMTATQMNFAMVKLNRELNKKTQRIIKRKTQSAKIANKNVIAYSD